MSTDKELLKKAARAAGLYWWEDGDAMCTHGESPGSSREWNPLTDDGDALRLAVKLGIDVQQFSAWACAWKGSVEAEVDYGTDPYAATRRAIVRAAASIGEGGVILSTAELRGLTGRARRSDQEAWLLERGIPYRWDGERLLVSRSMADQWLAGKELPVYREPNLAGVR